MQTAIKLPENGILGRKFSKKKPLPPAKELEREFTNLSKGRTKVPEKVEYWKDQRDFVRKVYSTHWFDLFIGFVIVSNAIQIGVDQSFDLVGMQSSATKTLEDIFLVIYVLELGFRFFAYGLITSLKSSWVRLDVVLVLLGIITSWIVDPLVGQKAQGLGPLLVLRLLRLLRLVRILRLLRVLSKIPEFWVMVRGFLNGWNIMVCTVTTFTLTLYIFSCMAVEIITKHPLNKSDPEFRDHVDTFFPNLPTAMLTLVRFAVLDNTSEVYFPLVNKDPWLFLFFGMVLLTISIVTFNLLGAVLYSSTIELGVQETDAARRAQQDEWCCLMTDLKKMFIRLDKDGSGHLSEEEIRQIHPDDMSKLSQALRCSTPFEIFQSLDVDGSGEISIAEFFDGALDIMLDGDDKKALGIKRMEKQVETMHWRLKDLFTTQHDLELKVNRIFEEVKGYKDFKLLPSGVSTPMSAYDVDDLKRGQRPTDTAEKKARDDTREWLQELTSRLQQIWAATLHQSMELTLQQARAFDEKMTASNALLSQKVQSRSKSASAQLEVTDAYSEVISVGSQNSATRDGGFTSRDSKLRDPGLFSNRSSKRRPSNLSAVSTRSQNLAPSEASSRCSSPREIPPSIPASKNYGGHLADRSAV